MAAPAAWAPERAGSRVVSRFQMVGVVLWCEWAGGLCVAVAVTAAERGSLALSKAELWWTMASILAYDRGILRCPLPFVEAPCMSSHVLAAPQQRHSMTSGPCGDCKSEKFRHLSG
eukprot:365089-Chlamydomonas_euryale.AAC.8